MNFKFIERATQYIFLRTYYVLGTIPDTKVYKDEHTLVLALKEGVFQLSLLILHSLCYRQIQSI